MNSMGELVDMNGLPLRKTERRRLKSGQIKHTDRGDIVFHLSVDLPDNIGEDDFNKFMYEYFNIGAEAFRKKL